MPRRRLTTQKSTLPKPEIAICLRIKDARERIGLDQAEAARRLGVKIHVLSNLEKCRAPLRFDLAVRFCRELFVNEEWLATGATAALAADLRSVSSKTLDLKPWDPLFFRTPLDLASHEVLKAVPPRTLYSEAFERFLQPVAARLSRGKWLMPLIAFSAYDRPHLRAEYLALLVDRWSSIIRFRAEEKGLPTEAWGLIETDLVDNLTLASMLVFYRSLEIPTPFQSDARFDFLRTLISDDRTPIGSLSSVQEVAVTASGKVTFASGARGRKKK